MSAMKLQKLIYYSQAWSLVWDDEPLFPERIEAWINGPVVPELYERHKGEFKVTAEIVGGKYGRAISNFLQGFSIALFVGTMMWICI